MDVGNYLKYAMELEKGLYTLNKAIGYLKYRGNQLSGIEKQYQKPVEPKEPGKIEIGVIIRLIVAGTLLLGIPIGSIWGLRRYFDGEGFVRYLFGGMIIGAVVSAIVVLGMLLLLFDDVEEKEEYNNELKKYNIELEKYNTLIQKDQARVQRELQQKKSIDAQIGTLTKQKNEISHTLSKLYDMNVLYPKYRNFVAIATMYEYFESGRCSILEGHEGAYNVFENEIRLNAIIGKLDDIISHLEEIRSNQYAIYNAISEGNRIANDVYQRSEQILSSVDVMASNSAITAYNSQITAKNSEILGFIATYNAIRY